MRKQLLAAALALATALPVGAQQKFTDWGWPTPYEKVSDKSVKWLQD
jgi:sulfonate transport system substrate-binding protein